MDSTKLSYVRRGLTRHLARSPAQTALVDDCIYNFFDDVKSRKILESPDMAEMTWIRGFVESESTKKYGDEFNRRLYGFGVEKATGKLAPSGTLDGSWPIPTRLNPESKKS